jgi:uncharacterized membrane protein YgcG
MKLLIEKAIELHLAGEDYDSICQKVEEYKKTNADIGRILLYMFIFNGRGGRGGHGGGGFGGGGGGGFRGGGGSTGGGGAGGKF